FPLVERNHSAIPTNTFWDGTPYGRVSGWCCHILVVTGGYIPPRGARVPGTRTGACAGATQDCLDVRMRCWNPVVYVQAESSAARIPWSCKQGWVMTAAP